jgi:hypothetical protein
MSAHRSLRGLIHKLSLFYRLILQFGIILSAFQGDKQQDIQDNDFARSL